MASCRQPLGELEKRDQVAQGQPWEHHDVERISCPGFSLLLLVSGHDAVWAMDRMQLGETA